MRRVSPLRSAALVLGFGLVVASVSPAVAAAPAVRTAAGSHRVDTSALTERLDAYLATRKGSASVSFQDLSTGQWYTYRPRRPYATASIVKVDILAALLLQRQRAGTTLTKKERALASRMIRLSDNDATDVLWARIGGWKGLAAANKRLGLVATRRPLAGRWGSTQTTAADQVRLLRTLSRTDCVLRTSARDYLFTLMRTVTPSQRWGVAKATDRGTTAKVKDGWAPELVDGGRWEINSIGLVRIRGHLVAMSVLTRGNPDMPYGQATVKRLTSIANAALRG